MQKTKTKTKIRTRKAVRSSGLPIIIAGSKPEPISGFPVDAYSYSLFSLFCTNPVLARVKYVNRDVIDTTRSATSVLGETVHYGLKAFLGGCDEYPYMATDTDADRLKVAYDAVIDFLKKYPDGFIDWKPAVPTRERLQELALKAIPGYIKEWDRGHIKETLIVDTKLSETIRLTVGNRAIELAIPLVGYPDHVYIDKKDRVMIDDHKTVFRYSDPDAVDGSKLIQAAMYYLLVYANTGRAPYSMTFREYKIPENADGSSKTREYVIIYEEMPIVFDLFFRLYQDITDLLLGKAVFLPNIMAMWDRDVALLTYIYRLDEPDNVEKEKKRAGVGDVAVILQQKVSRSKNLKRFMEAKANLFTSNISLNYKDMKNPYDRIKYKMLEHGIALTFIDHIEGLSVNLYRFEPTVGVKMTTVEKFQKDIEQILGVSGVRILAPIPNTEYVGFEVPKKKRQFVSLGDAKKAASLEIPVGVDVYGERRDVDIREMPHMLIGGSSGSGKSVFLHALLKSLARLPQHEIRFALLDPKMVELSSFQDDKHVDFYRDDPAEILSTLMHYVDHMKERYAAFKKAKVRNLAEYREKVGKDLPYVVVVIDEFGDLIMQGGDMAKEIKRCMIVLAQKARAAGIHLIITTQRPSTKVVDGLIKANFPTRVAFRTTSRTDSEIILDRTGAEVLLGKGDMLIIGAGHDIERLQGFNID